VLVIELELHGPTTTAAAATSSPPSAAAELAGVLDLAERLAPARTSSAPSAAAERRRRRARCRAAAIELAGEARVAVRSEPSHHVVAIPRR
jgi:hypothetical protein